MRMWKNALSIRGRLIPLKKPRSSSIECQRSWKQSLKQKEQKHVIMLSHMSLNSNLTFESRNFYILEDHFLGVLTCKFDVEKHFFDVFRSFSSISGHCFGQDACSFLQRRTQGEPKNTPIHLQNHQYSLKSLWNLILHYEGSQRFEERQNSSSKVRKFFLEKKRDFFRVWGVYGTLLKCCHCRWCNMRIKSNFGDFSVFWTQIGLYTVEKFLWSSLKMV